MQLGPFLALVTHGKSINQFLFQAIAIPSLDYVSPKTNTIESYSSPIKWTFNLQLTIIPFEVMFGELVEQEDTHPITSPAMDGSIFTLTKVRLFLV